MLCLEIVRGCSMRLEYLRCEERVAVRVGEWAKKWAKLASRRVIRVEGTTDSGGIGQPVEVLARRDSFSAEEIQCSNIHRVRSNAWCVPRSVVLSRRCSRISIRRALASLTRNSSCFVAYCIEGLGGKSRSYSASRLTATVKADSSRE